MHLVIKHPLYSVYSGSMKKQGTLKVQFLYQTGFEFTRGTVMHPVSIMKTCPCNKQIFFTFKNRKCSVEKKNDYFLFFAQNIDCGYKVEPPRRGGYNEYLQSMFWSKNKKKKVYPCIPHFLLQKSGE